jgi:meckelin
VLYSERGDVLLVQEDIGDTFATRESSQGTHGLNVVLASYALNGSFLGFQDGSEELMLCDDAYIRSLGYWPVGMTYQQQCNVRIDQLQTKGRTPMFYSPYLRVGDTLYSIPVLVEGLRGDNGALVNSGTDRTSWRLAKLFYLAESTSTDGVSTNYASYMELMVEPRGGGLIYPSHLRIRYSSSSGVSSQTVQVQFSVVYEGSVLAQQIAVGVVVGVLSLLSLFYVGFKVYGYIRRSGRNFCELPTLFFMVAECCSLIAGIVFVVVLLTSIVVLIFFKSQVPLAFVLPTDHQEVMYIVLVALGLLCELVNIVYIMWFQCSVDIFFIDWEKPKGQIVTADTTTQTPEGSLKVAPVSIWRTYFVANEWNEIQSLRKGHPLVLLLAVLLLLEVISLGNIGNREPIAHVFYDSSEYTPPSSRILRFALAAMFYSFLALLMRLYVLLIHERFVEHKLKQFVDLCSISNISVLVLSHLKYGYYIHGRSVHGFADTDMKEMSGFFKKEELNLVAKRGLTSNNDNQVYDAAFTDDFRKYFNSILISAKSTEVQGTDQERSEGASENRLRAYYNMNGFLTSFIDKVWSVCT